MSEQIDYAAIIRASKQSGETIPSYLAVDKEIYAKDYGTGTIVSILGNCLIVKFPNQSSPIKFKNWRKAIEKGELSEQEKAPVQPVETFNPQELQKIQKPEFRAIGNELSSVLTNITVLPPAKGELFPLPFDLPAALKVALTKVGIKQLYGHQLESLVQLRKGKDLALATPTASGKTLCYNLAILESCLNSKAEYALYIFPLKALAFDQLSKLELIVQALPKAEIKIGEITGDTPYQDRLKLFTPTPPHILVVSPDLLHYQLEKIQRISQWAQWREFLRCLRWIVIDESHTYIGAFGAHFANLMRRLRRAVDSVGGDSNKLQFICSSATIGNPAQVAMQFSGRTNQPERLHLIETSKGYSASKTILSILPTSSPNPDTSKIVLNLLQQGLSGIVFCNARASVKNLLKLIQREANRNNISHLADKVAPFYGSLKSDHRRRLIQQLETGQIKVILSTSALEAGIDLPEMDCCIIRGYPGSIMSFRQRIGRVGRQHPGLVIFIPINTDPLDFYYGHHPEELLSSQVESAAFNPNYPTILSKHLQCCCYESGLPFAQIEKSFGKGSNNLVGELLNQDKLTITSANDLRATSTPHREVNIRGSGNNTVELVDIATNEPFEEMSLELAYREVFQGAIYTASDAHGKLIIYQCERLNLESRKAFLKALPPDCELFTQSESNLDVKIQGLLEEPIILPTPIPFARVRLRLHWGEITTSVTGYKLQTRSYRLTCINRQCSGHGLPLEGKQCSRCHHILRYAEITTLKEEVIFKTPYQSKYQAPVVKVEINPLLKEGIIKEANRLRLEIKAQYKDDIPDDLKTLWTTPPDFLALHSAAHQLIFALPLIVLSSSKDINSLVVDENKRIVNYFFDTSDGGNGAVESLFQQMSTLASKARLLVEACDCKNGCPRCLTQHGCPQKNEGLNKALGLFS